MFGEFNEAAQPKTSLAKCSIAFNDLAVQMRPPNDYVTCCLIRMRVLLFKEKNVIHGILVCFKN